MAGILSMWHFAGDSIALWHIRLLLFFTPGRFLQFSLDLWLLGFEGFLKSFDSGFKICLGKGEEIPGYDQRLAKDTFHFVKPEDS